MKPKMFDFILLITGSIVCVSVFLNGNMGIAGSVINNSVEYWGNNSEGTNSTDTNSVQTNSVDNSTITENPNLEFGLFAWDANSKDVVTAATKQVELGLTMRNNSPASYYGVSIQVNSITLSTPSVGVNPGETVPYPAIGTVSFENFPVKSFSVFKQYITDYTPNGFKFAPNMTRSGLIIAEANLTVTVYTVKNDKKPLSFNTTIDEVVYK